MRIIPGLGLMLPPKTGTTTLEYLIREYIGIPIEKPRLLGTGNPVYGNKHFVPEPDDPIWGQGIPSGIRLAMLKRKDRSWLESVYANMVPNKDGGIGKPLSDITRLPHSSKEEFMTKAFALVPEFWHYYTRHYPDYIIRTECLADDLINVLRDVGYEIDESKAEAMKSAESLNVTMGSD